MNKRPYDAVNNLNSTAIFDFYDLHQQEAMSEFILPAIYNGAMNEKNEFTYTESVVDHEPKYFLYFSFGKVCRGIQFTEHDLNDEKSLFHEDNLNTKIYSWWKIIETQMSNYNLKTNLDNH